MNQIPPDIIFDHAPSERIASNGGDAMLHFRDKIFGNPGVDGEIMLDGLGVFPFGFGVEALFHFCNRERARCKTSSPGTIVP